MMRELRIQLWMVAPRAVPIGDVAVVPLDDFIADKHHRVGHTRARLVTLGVDVEGDRLIRPSVWIVVEKLVLFTLANGVNVAVQVFGEEPVDGHNIGLIGVGKGMISHAFVYPRPSGVLKEGLTLVFINHIEMPPIGRRAEPMHTDGGPVARRASQSESEDDVFWFVKLDFASSDEIVASDDVDRVV